MNNFFIFYLIYCQTISAPMQQKFLQYNTNDLKNINVSLESSKNKNFTVDHKSLVIGNDLKEAQEYENKLSYGIKSVGGGVFSLNAINSKIYGQNTDNTFVGMSYNLQSKYSSVLFSYKSADSVKQKENTLMELQLKAKF